MNEETTPASSAQGESASGNSEIKIDIKVVAVVGVLLLSVIAYLLYEKDISKENRIKVNALSAATSGEALPGEIGQVQTHGEEKTSSRVVLSNIMSDKKKWNISIVLPSVDKTYIVEERSWMVEDPMFYLQTVQGLAIDQDENKEQYFRTGAEQLASTTGKRKLQTGMSAEVIRLNQLRDGYVNAKQSQLNSLKTSRDTYITNTLGKTYPAGAVNSLLATYPVLIDILNSQIALIDYLIQLDKKILEAVNTGNVELAVQASEDDILLRTVAPWYENGYSSELSKQSNLQLSMVQNDLQSLTEQLKVLASQQESATSTGSSTPN